MNSTSLQRSYLITEILGFLPEQVELEGNPSLSFDNFQPVFEADSSSLVWIHPGRADKQTLIEQTAASIIICDKTATLPAGQEGKKCLLKTERPDLAFVKILNGLCTPALPEKTFIHPTALVHPDARIGEKVYIGPFCEIGACEIGNETHIESFCKIYDHSSIGNRVIINSHCCIGNYGYGYIKDENDKHLNYYHIGAVRIEDEVELFPFCNIDRGTLGTTLIGKGSKLGHHANITHNSTVGEYTLILPNVVMCGSSHVGNHCWIGASSVIREKTKIGDHVIIGMGSAVNKNIKSEEFWSGNPARKLDPRFKYLL